MRRYPGNSARRAVGRCRGLGGGYSGGPAGQGMWWYAHTNGPSTSNSTFSSLWHFTPASFGGQNMGLFRRKRPSSTRPLISNRPDFANTVAYWDGNEYWWWF